MKAPKKLVTLTELYAKKVLKEERDLNVDESKGLYTAISVALQKNNIQLHIEEGDNGLIIKDYFGRDYRVSVTPIS
jgi:predicted RNA-binding protein YlqC (UPF0109 family)